MNEAFNKVQAYKDAHSDLKRQLELATKDNEAVREQREEAHKNLLATNAMLDNTAAGTSEATDRMKELVERLREQDE